MTRIRGVHQEVQQAARTLRRDMTPAERLLWEGLRRNGAGCRFRRQHPIGPFILDFCCPSLRLVVDLDGVGHDDPVQVRRDAARTAWLQERGYRVQRFRNEEVLADVGGVMASVTALAATIGCEGQARDAE